MTREDFVRLRNWEISIQQENNELFKRLNDGKPVKEDFGDRRAGIADPSIPFIKGVTGEEALKAGAFVLTKDGEVFEVQEPLRSRRDKEGEEGWDGSERVLYVQDLGGGDAQGYRISDLTKIERVIPRDWQKRLKGR